MLVMQQLFFYFTIFGVTVLAGYPTAILLGDNSTNLDRIPRSLLLGSALIMLPSYWMIMFDVSMRYAAYILGLLGEFHACGTIKNSRFQVLISI